MASSSNGHQFRGSGPDLPAYAIFSAEANHETPTLPNSHCIPPPNPRRSIHSKSPPPAPLLNLFDILGPAARGPEITAAVSVLAGNDETERGAIFTRPDVVAAILDLSGYSATQPLRRIRPRQAAESAR